MASAEKVIVLDRGNVELLYPGDWSVKPDPGGFVVLTDPTDSCKLELSYLRLPPLPPGAPSLEERLRHALINEPQIRQASELPVHIATRGGMQLAWVECDFSADDRERGEQRRAHGRWLVAANDLFQVLTAFYYWSDDASWAVPAWERMVETLNLGTGHQLRDPAEHWAMKDRH